LDYRRFDGCNRLHVFGFRPKVVVCKAGELTAMQLDPINWKMIAHPMNWAIVLLMLIIAGAIGHMLLSLAGIEPASKAKSGYANLPQGQVPADAAINAINPQTAGLVD
jgi:hypothetical protein